MVNHRFLSSSVIKIDIVGTTEVQERSSKESSFHNAKLTNTILVVSSHTNHRNNASHNKIEQISELGRLVVIQQYQSSQRINAKVMEFIKKANHFSTRKSYNRNGPNGVGTNHYRTHHWLCSWTLGRIFSWLSTYVIFSIKWTSNNDRIDFQDYLPITTINCYMSAGFIIFYGEKTLRDRNPKHFKRDLWCHDSY